MFSNPTGFDNLYGNFHLHCCNSKPEGITIAKTAKGHEYLFETHSTASENWH